MSFFHPLWLALLIGASALLTTSYTCITPFAAFAVIAATAMSRGHAVLLTVAVWLVNQVVGFVVLSYPWTGTTLAWGLAIGAAAVVGTLAAHWTVRRLAFRPVAGTLAAFAAAFVVYEVALYAAAVSALGGTEAFAPGIVGQVLLVNAATFVGLYGLGQLIAVAATFLGRRRRAHASVARPA